MTDATYDTSAPTAGTLAAIIAAVEAYLEDEARSELRGPRRLNEWKTVPWRMIRGDVDLLHRTWRTG